MCAGGVRLGRDDDDGSEYRNPADHGYLCWLGLPLGLLGAISEYQNSWGSGISMLAGATGTTSGATWGYL